MNRAADLAVVGRMLLWTLAYTGVTVAAAVYMTSVENVLVQRLLELVFLVFGTLALIGLAVIGYALVEQAAIYWLEMRDRRRSD